MFGVLLLNPYNVSLRKGAGGEAKLPSPLERGGGEVKTSLSFGERRGVRFAFHIFFIIFV